jgi:hypothetical protein
MFRLCTFDVPVGIEMYGFNVQQSRPIGESCCAAIAARDERGM